MNCKNCNEKVEANWEYCPKCGAGLRNEKSENTEKPAGSEDSENIENIKNTDNNDGRNTEDKNKKITQQNQDKSGILQNQNTQNTQLGKSEKICLCVFFASLFALYVIDYYKWLFYLIALAAIVTGYVKFKNNKVFEFLFWAFTIGSVAFIIFWVFVFVIVMHLLAEWLG